MIALTELKKTLKRVLSTGILYITPFNLRDFVVLLVSYFSSTASIENICLPITNKSFWNQNRFYIILVVLR